MIEIFLLSINSNLVRNLLIKRLKRVIYQRVEFDLKREITPTHSILSSRKMPPTTFNQVNYVVKIERKSNRDISRSSLKLIWTTNHKVSVKESYGYNWSLLRLPKSMSMGLTSDEEDEESTPVINDITSPMEEGTPTAPLNITNNTANNMTGGIYSGLDPMKKTGQNHFAIYLWLETGVFHLQKESLWWSLWLYCREKSRVRVVLFSACVSVGQRLSDKEPPVRAFFGNTEIAKNL